MMESPYVYKDYVSYSYIYMAGLLMEVEYRDFLLKVMEENMKPTMADRGR